MNSWQIRGFSYINLGFVWFSIKIGYLETMIAGAIFGNSGQTGTDSVTGQNLE